MLLSRFVSSVVEVTVAVLVIVPVDVSDTAPLINTTLDSPSTNVPKSILPVHGLNVNPPSIEYSGAIILSGISSVNITSSEAFGPLFVTTII